MPFITEDDSFMESTYYLYELASRLKTDHWKLTGAQIGILLICFPLLYLFFATMKIWRRLSSFSGPFLSSVSHIPMLRIRLSGQSHLEYASLSNRYGSLVRIGPNDLLSADPDHLRRMSAVRSFYERSNWYKATRLDPYHDMMGSTLNKAAHAVLRSKTIGGYTGKDIPMLEQDIDSQIQALVDLIERDYLTSSDTTEVPVDFGKLSDFYAR